MRRPPRRERKAAAELAEALLRTPGAPNLDFYRQHLEGVIAEAEETLAVLRSDERMGELEQRVERLEQAFEKVWGVELLRVGARVGSPRGGSTSTTKEGCDQQSRRKTLRLAFRDAVKGWMSGPGADYAVPSP
jgi:hypothetical protein